MRVFLQAIFFAGLLLLARTEAYACFCVYDEVPRAVESAEAVFAGFVTGYSPDSGADGLYHDLQHSDTNV